MRYYTTRPQSMALALLIAGLSVSLLCAEDTAGQRAKDLATNRSSSTRVDSKTYGSSIRASQFVGMKIENPDGKSLGEINDLVIDANYGRIDYAAVTYGGFLGIGNKLFAVPFEAFKWRENANGSGHPVLILNVTKEQLEGSEGFDKEHWPNFADERVSTEIYNRYKIDRSRSRRAGSVGIDLDRDGDDVHANLKTGATK